MPHHSLERRRDLLALAADGCVITAGVFGLMMGTAFGLEWMGVAPLGEPGGSGVDLLLSTISWLLQVGGFVVGPVVTWALYRRRFSKGAVIGMLAGFPLGGALALPVVMLGAFFDWFVGLFTDVLYVGAIGYLVAVALGFLAVLVWRDAEALRNLSSGASVRVWLDIGRLVATLAVAALAAGAVAAALAGHDALDVGVFMLLAGVQGAVVVTSADVIGRLIESNTEGSAAHGA